jgi:hypothetical protein
MEMTKLFCERFIVIDDSTNKMQQSRGEPNRSNLLFGKAVLLIGNDTAVLQNLVQQLAQKGADVALLCWKIPAEVARKMQAYVQSFGQQLILIQQVENQRFSVEQLIHNVTTRWGQFDIFIDVSAKGKAADKSEAGDKEEQQPAWLLPNWEMTRAVVQEMAQA